MTEHILVQTEARIQKIQLKRPEKKNALTRAMYSALAEAIGQGEADDDIRAIFITGSDGSFSSGNDIMDFLQGPVLGENSPVSQFLAAISQAKKPIVAAVNGVAVGIGATMLLHCDLVYAAESARFRLPFVNLGLNPEAGSSYLLPQMMGYHRAAELVLLGDFFDADMARKVGIVNAVYTDDDLLENAWQKALQLAAQPPAALRLAKSLLKRSSAPAIAEAMREEGKHFAGRLQSPEAAEAMQAFMERRKPDFSRFK